MSVIEKKLKRDLAVDYVNGLVTEPIPYKKAMSLLGPLHQHNVKILLEIALRRVVYNKHYKIWKSDMKRKLAEGVKLSEILNLAPKNPGIPEVFKMLSQSEIFAIKYAWTVYRDELLEKDLAKK